MRNSAHCALCDFFFHYSEFRVGEQKWAFGGGKLSDALSLSCVLIILFSPFGTFYVLSSLVEAVELNVQLEKNEVHVWFECTDER